MKIAIVGSGISGLVTAHHLQREHEIVLFEAEARLGGHTHTVSVESDGEQHEIDTGFIVYNEATYPNFVRLLAELGVATQPTEMSFGVHCERSGVEWSSRGLRGIFAQPRNLLDPAHHRMLRDVLRFNRESRRLLGSEESKLTLRDYVAGAGHSPEFVERYLVPMGAAIWSAAPERFLDFPAARFVRFFDNHGLLQSNPTLRWRVICGGSSRYVERLAAPLHSAIRLGCPVRAIRRWQRSVEVISAAGAERFDHVVLAVHSDQALRLLADATGPERVVLGAIGYQRNEVVLHRDESLLPRARAAQASWNYRVPQQRGAAALVTYDMNRLQGLDAKPRFLVTLNPGERIDPERVLGRYHYDHPVFDCEAIRAQQRWSLVSGQQRTHFCGAYWGNGFHEDGVRSALAVVESLGRGAAR